MELRDYWRIVVQRGWIVLLAMLLTAGSAYLWSKAQPPEYRASALLVVRADTMEFGRIQASKQVLSNFATIIRSENSAFRVVDRLKLDLNPYEVLEKVAVSTDSNALTIQIAATDHDAERAGRIANGFAEEFEAEIREANSDQLRENRVEVGVIQRAGVGGLIGPQPTINAIAGALLGLALGGFVVLALELLDDTIKTQEDVERYLGRDIIVLGHVPPGQPDLAPYAPRKKGFWMESVRHLRGSA